MILRVTGKVLLTEKKQFGAADRVFKFTEAKVQTGIASIESVRFTDSWLDAHDVPRAGELIDLAVEISGFGGRNGVQLSATAVEPFNEEFALTLVA